MPEPPAPPDAAPPTRVARRRARTRERLLEATRALIGEKGVSGLRISEITERADVALGSFYNHFEAKDDVVAAVVGEALEELAASVAGDDLPEPHDDAVVVCTAIRRFVDLAYDDGELARLLVNLSTSDAVFAAAVQPFARRAVARGVAAGRFSVATPEVTVVWITGGALAVMRAIVDGRDLGAEAGRELAEQSLLALGVPADDVRRIVDAGEAGGRR